MKNYHIIFGKNTVKKILKDVVNKKDVERFIFNRGNYVAYYEGETEDSVKNSFNEFIKNKRN